MQAKKKYTYSVAIPFVPTSSCKTPNTRREETDDMPFKMLQYFQLTKQSQYYVMAMNTARPKEPTIHNETKIICDAPEQQFYRLRNQMCFDNFDSPRPDFHPQVALTIYIW
jgi:hypothetical protein